ncbi:MAG: hypothetical protein J3R72DRAFT_160139 [Linnemannia gamsii]|nr:MAG: hypothetical protein J3R72DRAFT_160139 [Linnemannia gamsii]
MGMSCPEKREREKTERQRDIRCRLVHTMAKQFSLHPRSHILAKHFFKILFLSSLSLFFLFISPPSSRPLLSFPPSFLPSFISSFLLLLIPLTPPSLLTLPTPTPILIPYRKQATLLYPHTLSPHPYPIHRITHSKA